MKIKITKHTSAPYTVDDDIYRRWAETDSVYWRHDHDPDAPHYKRSNTPRALELAQAETPGYTRIEQAMSAAAWTIQNHFPGAYSGSRLGGTDALQAALGPLHPVDSAEMSAVVKRAARTYGADAVGITKVDRRWVYTHDRVGDVADLAETYTYAIVMAVAMDPVGIRTSPAVPASIATGMGYSRMAFTAVTLAQFIRRLGYDAHSAGNDTALSIPLAIDAGLGEMGRSGMLITPEFGPCVRLCKVITDLPLLPDPPITFGVQETCRSCGRCAEACPAGAISTDDTPSFKLACPSNNPGVLRWPVNVDLCYDFWNENGTSCSNCIAVCPYTPQP